MVTDGIVGKVLAVYQRVTGALVTDSVLPLVWSPKNHVRGVLKGSARKPPRGLRAAGGKVEVGEWFYTPTRPYFTRACLPELLRCVLKPISGGTRRSAAPKRV